MADFTAADLNELAAEIERRRAAGTFTPPTVAAPVPAPPPAAPAPKAPKPEPNPKNFDELRALSWAERELVPAERQKALFNAHVAQKNGRAGPAGRASTFDVPRQRLVEGKVETTTEYFEQRKKAFDAIARGANPFDRAVLEERWRLQP